MTSREALSLCKTAYHEWQDDRAPRLGAALAYYSLFSLAPMLIIAMAVAGILFGSQNVQQELTRQIQHLVGTQAAGAVTMMLENAHRPASGIVAAVIGIVSLILAAMGVFTELQDALNTIWRVPRQRKISLMAAIRAKFLSFAMVLGIGFLLMTSLVLSTLLSVIGTYLGGELNSQVNSLFGEMLNTVASFVIITLLFAMIYRILPEREIAWSDVWLGALITSALFTAGKFLIGRYLGVSSISSAYGAAGSLLVLMLWVYYSAQILFYGAEFTRVYAERHGSLAQAGVTAEQSSAGDNARPAVHPAGS